MTTQLFKAKDVKSAISKVTEEFGNDAIILSTKKNNGLVEIEASNDNNVLTSFPRNNQENKAFSKIFLKKLENKDLKISNKKEIRNQSKIDSKTTKYFNKNELNEEFNDLKKEIKDIKKQLYGMFLTNESSLCDSLSASTPVKLSQCGFSNTVINELNYTFQGKNLEEGKISFFREMSKKLASLDFQRLFNSKNIFIFGNSGSGKSTLAAKLASYISDEKKCNVNFIEVSNTSTNNSEVLRAYSRVLGFKLINFNNFQFSKNQNEGINIFDFSGDLNFSLSKIDHIKNNYRDFDFCSILSIQSGSNSTMINNIWKQVSGIKPMVAITKLDECWTGAEELSTLAFNKARIGLFTGTKVIIDSILPATENSLTKYMKENFQGV